MSVFPAASRSHVPPAWQSLMIDPDSPIIDFYPTDFKVDLNGKRLAWMGVALLPFVDEVRLLKALDDRRSQLTDEERHRNLRRPVLYFVHVDSPMGKTLTALYSDQPVSSTEVLNYSGKAPNDAILINAALTEGISGHIWPVTGSTRACLPGEQMTSGVPGLLPDIQASQQHAISAFYENPPYPFGHIFPARLLDSVKLPPKSELRPSTARSRGRGGFRGGSYSGVNGNNSNSWGRESTNWRSDQTPMERMIRRSLPAYNEPRPPHGYQPSYGSYQQPNYPPAYPPPYGVFANPYGGHLPQAGDDYGWNRRGRGGGRPYYRGGGGGGGGGYYRR